MNRLLTSFKAAAARPEGMGALLFLAAALVSLSFWTFRDRPLERRLLYFPHQSHENLSAEARMLPRRDSPEASAALLVEETLLGPAYPWHLRLFPRSSRVRSVLWRPPVLYVDLDRRALESIADLDLDLPARFAYLERTLRANPPFPSKILFSLEGRELELEGPFSRFLKKK